MAVFGPLQLTTQGQSLYTKAQTGTTLTLTRMQIGGGQLAGGQDPTTLTALITPIAYFNINSELVNGTTVSIRGIFENTNLTSATYVCEIGLFAQDPTAGEILYAYANAGTQGDTLPPIGDGPISRQFNLNLSVSNATNVTVNIPANTYIPNNLMGVANGVPTLDANGKVPSSQLVDLTAQTNNFTKTQQFTAPSSSIEANQIILGITNNVSSPASPVYLASANASGVGMDASGNLLPINPAAVSSGNSWSVKGKSGNKDLEVFTDGSHKVKTLNNVLDDGSGNIVIAGGLTVTNTIAGPITPAENYTTPTMNSPYSPQLAGYRNGYLKDRSGMVHVWIMVQGASSAGTVFTLPVGYRPTQTISVSATSYDSTRGMLPARATIATNGNVGTNDNTANGWFVAYYCFKAEQ